MRALLPLLLRGALYGLSTAIGIVAFVYPFLMPMVQSPVMGQTHTRDAPLLLTALVGLCFVALLLEVQGQAVNAKFVALLGILVSINAVLRFVEVAIPAPGGFSPIFFLIVLTGYVFGGRFGFLMGALTLLVSALITGTVGLWLPYQMFTAGWIGLSAPLCGLLARAGPVALGSHPRIIRDRNPWDQRGEVVILAIFGGIWGLAYGAIMNVWFWPFAIGPIDQYWAPGIGFIETLKRYGAFYLTTSLGWDAIRAVGNVLATLAFGPATLRALRRFQRRFAFSYRQARATEPSLTSG